MEEMEVMVVTTVEVVEVVVLEEVQEEVGVEEALITKVEIMVKEVAEEEKVEVIEEEVVVVVVIKTVNKTTSKRKIKNKDIIIDKTLHLNNMPTTMKARISIKNSCNIKIDKMKQTLSNIRTRGLFKIIIIMILPDPT